MPSWAPQNCKCCGKNLVGKTTGRPRVFCSPACKQATYRVTKVNRKARGNYSHPTIQPSSQSLDSPAAVPSRIEGGEP